MVRLDGIERRENEVFEKRILIKVSGGHRGSARGEGGGGESESGSTATCGVEAEGEGGRPERAGVRRSNSD